MTVNITCIDHGVYGARPEECPLCPLCDQPVYENEPITIQTVEWRPHEPDLIRLVHTMCAEQDEEE